MKDPVEVFESANGKLFKMHDFVSDTARAGDKLFLTGSRFFGGAQRYSDWDFFCKDSNKTRDNLTLAGFKPVPGCGEYSDSITTDVWIGHIANEPVHIQFVSDVQIKQAAQHALLATKALTDAEALLGANTRDYDHKKMRRLLWNLALEAVNEK